MAEKRSHLLVGVFEDRAQAQKAYDELRRAGFGQDYVGLAEHGKGEANLRKQLMEADVPEEDANFYQQEFDQGRFLVTLRAGGLGQDSIAKAASILKRNGAYDATSRAGDRSRIGANVKSDTSSPYFDVAPGADLNKPAGEE